MPKRIKRNISKRLWKVLTNGLELTRDFFPNWIGDHDFELSDYVEFLNKINSRDDLLRGLRQLDPFVDDALAAVETMTDEEFPVFKAALAIERQFRLHVGDTDQLELTLPIGSSSGQQMPESIMPEKFYPILLPMRFIDGQMVAKQFDTSLEIAMGRIYKSQLTERRNRREEVPAGSS